MGRENNLFPFLQKLHPLVLVEKIRAGPFPGRIPSVLELGTRSSPSAFLADGQGVVSHSPLCVTQRRGCSVEVSQPVSQMVRGTGCRAWGSWCDLDKYIPEVPLQGHHRQFSLRISVIFLCKISLEANAWSSVEVGNIVIPEKRINLHFLLSSTDL